MYNVKKRTCLGLFWNKMRYVTIDNETSLKEGGVIEFKSKNSKKRFRNKRNHIIYLPLRTSSNAASNSSNK